jgi:hypothetical protein
MATQKKAKATATDPGTTPTPAPKPKKRTTQTEALGGWQKLLGMLEAHVTEIPQLEPFRAKLGTLVGQALDLTKQQADHRANKQDASKQLKQLTKSGRRLAAVVRSALIEHYGVSEEKLAAFGLQPFRGRPRKDQPSTTPAPTPAPSPSPEVAPAPVSPPHPTA